MLEHSDHARDGQIPGKRGIDARHGHRIASGNAP
jgi:hypothetical protein